MDGVNWLKRREALWGFLVSGLMVVLSFPPFDLRGLAWLALVPAVLAAGSGKRAFWPGYGFGALYFGGTLWWIGHVTVAGMAALSLYLALYPALWFWVIARLWRRLDWSVGANVAFGAMGASLWVLLDWTRGWMLTGFTWNYLGTAVVGNVPLMQLAKLGGAHVLTWLVVFVNAMVARQIGKWSQKSGGRSQEQGSASGRADQTGVKPPRSTYKRQPFYELYVALGLVTVCFTWGFREAMKPPQGREKSLRYACIQPNVPQNAYRMEMDDGEILERHYRLTTLAAQTRPELIIWPEATTSVDFTKDPVGAQPWQAVRGIEACGLLMGTMEYEEDAVYNAAAYFAKGSDEIELYRKNRLVMFGEYTPLANYFPVLRQLVPYATDFSASPSPAVFVAGEERVRVAPLICFEDTLADFVRYVAVLEPDVFINMTNDSWFYNSPGAEQHLRNAILRTVETGLPMIRCGNTGVTCEIDTRGVVTARLASASDKWSGLGEEGILVRQMRWRVGGPTLYQRWGEWIVGVSALVCIATFFRLRKNLAPRRKDAKNF